MRKNMGFMGFILVILTVVSVFFVVTVRAQSTQIITIDAKGQITPTNEAIQRYGNIYILSANLSSSIIVEANNIVLDGEGYTLKGPSESLTMGGIAVNLTATNVTVENICITNWGVGILGAWNNNTITNNVLTANDEAIVVYGDDEIVRQNDISNSTIAIFIDGGSQKEDNELVKLNQITANTQAFDITNSNGVTITANNVANNDAILALGQISGGVVVW